MNIDHMKNDSNHHYSIGDAIIQYTVSHIVNSLRHPELFTESEVYNFVYLLRNSNGISDSHNENLYTPKDLSILEEVNRQVSQIYDYKNNNPVQVFHEQQEPAKTHKKIQRIFQKGKVIAKIIVLLGSRKVIDGLGNIRKGKERYKNKLDTFLIADTHRDILIRSYQEYGVICDSSQTLIDLFAQLTNNGFGGFSWGSKTEISSFNLPNSLEIGNHEQIHSLQQKGFITIPARVKKYSSLKLLKILEVLESFIRFLVATPLFRSIQGIEVRLLKKQLSGIVGFAVKTAAHNYSLEWQTYPEQYNNLKALDKFELHPIKTLKSKQFRQDTVYRHYLRYIDHLNSLIEDLSESNTMAIDHDQTTNEAAISNMNISIQQIQKMQQSNNERDYIQHSISPRLDRPTYDKEHQITTFVSKIYQYILTKEESKNFNQKKDIILSDEKISEYIKEYISQYGKPSIKEQIYFFREDIHYTDIVYTGIENLFLQDKKDLGIEGHLHISLYFKSWLDGIIEEYMNRKQESLEFEGLSGLNRMYKQHTYEMKTKKWLISQLQHTYQKIKEHLISKNIQLSELTTFDRLENIIQENTFADTVDKNGKSYSAFDKAIHIFLTQTYRTPLHHHSHTLS